MSEEPLLPQDPPLVDVKVTNPVTYFKKWWAKIIGNEGIDFRFHIRPLTAIVISLAIASVGFGVGRFVMPFKLPFFETIETSTPAPSGSPNDIWKETAYIGTVQFSDTTQKFFLITTSSEAITLKVPENINLSTLIGKRILAIGDFNKNLRILIVKDAKDLEILPKSPLPLPTIVPTPTPSASPSATLTS